MSLENPRDGGDEPIGGLLSKLAVIELILRLEHVIFDRTIVESDNILLPSEFACGARCRIDLGIADQGDKGKGRVIEVSAEDGRVQ